MFIRFFIAIFVSLYHIRRRKTSAYTADAKKSDGDGVNVDVICVEKRLAGVKCDNEYIRGRRWFFINITVAETILY